MERLIHEYLQALQAASVERLLALFSPDAIVHSPLYGAQPPDIFYRNLFRDSAASYISLQGIYWQEDTAKAAAHFHYHWTLASGEQTLFEVVDLFEFDYQEKISSLRILYDTAQTRPAFDRQQNQGR